MTESQITELMALVDRFGAYGNENGYYSLETEKERSAIETFARSIQAEAHEQGRLQGIQQERALWELAKDGQEIEAAGQAYELPGAPAFTTAVFKASDVPAGTKLYTQDAAVPQVPDARFHAEEAADMVPTVREALEALENIDDCARMEGGVDAIGPRECLRRFITAAPTAKQESSK